MVTGITNVLNSGSSAVLASIPVTKFSTGMGNASNYIEIVSVTIFNSGIFVPNASPVPSNFSISISQDSASSFAVSAYNNSGSTQAGQGFRIRIRYTKDHA